jgi:hypothetical protein
LLLLPAANYRLDVFAATAVVAEVRGHEAGHFDGSIGQAWPFMELVVMNEAPAVARAELPPLQCVQPAIGQLAPFAAGTAAAGAATTVAVLACDFETCLAV